MIFSLRDLAIRRGLCAPCDVGKGEMLFMVPKAALMTSHSLMKNEDKMQTGISIIEGLGNIIKMNQVPGRLRLQKKLLQFTKLF
nr:hypothetical protein [Tanacetum cinerariifolium]